MYISGLIPTAPNPHANNTHSPTGFIFLTNSYDSACATPFLTYGVPVNQCIVEANYAYEFQIVQGRFRKHPNKHNCCSTDQLTQPFSSSSQTPALAASSSTSSTRSARSPRAARTLRSALTTAPSLRTPSSATALVTSTRRCLAPAVGTFPVPATTAPSSSRKFAHCVYPCWYFLR